MTSRRRQRSNRRIWWIAGAVAVGLHIALFVLLPPFRIEPLDGSEHASRMIISVGRWQEPACHPNCPTGIVAYDTVRPAPRLRNGAQVNYHLPRTYPATLWRYLEPANAMLDITISPGGAVRTVTIVDGSDNGANEAIETLARLMEFELDPTGDAGDLAATVQVAVVPVMR